MGESDPLPSHDFSMFLQMFVSSSGLDIDLAFPRKEWLPKTSQKHAEDTTKNKKIDPGGGGTHL